MVWKECRILRYPKFKILLVIEAVLLVLGFISSFQKDDVALDASSMTVSQAAGEKTAEGWHIDGSAAFQGEFLSAGGFELKPGVYELKIYYDAEDDTPGSYGIFTGEVYFKNLLTNEVPLYGGEKESTCQFYLQDKTDQLKVAVNYGGTKGLTVKGFEITHTAAGARMFVVCAVFFFLLLDAIICLYSYMGNHKIPKEKLVVILGIPMLTLLASIPIFTDYIIVGADSIFHWLRIEALADTLKSGVLPARVEGMWLYGHGYANSIFYCDTFLILPALLRIVGFPLTIAYNAYIFLINLATVWIAYISFKGCFKNRYVGMAGSMLYTLSPYRLYNIYGRCAVGEYTAMVFLPLLCYGFFMLFTGNVREKEYRRSWLILTLGFSGIIQSHVLSCEIAGMFVILLCLIMFKKILQKRIFWELCKTAAGTVLLNLWFILPFLDMMISGEYRYSNNTGTYIQHMGVMPAQIFYTMQNAGSSSLFHEAGMYQAEPISIGAALLFGVVVFFVFFSQNKEWRKTVYWKSGLVAFFLGAVALIMSTCYFPWDCLQGLNRITAALLPMIQFPTRLTTISTICLSFVVCAVSKGLLCDREMSCHSGEMPDRVSIGSQRYHKYCERGIWRKGFFAVLCSTCILFSAYQTNDVLLGKEGAIWLYSTGAMGHAGILGGEYLPKDIEMDNRFHDAIGSGGVVIKKYEKDHLDTVTSLAVNDEAGEYYVQLPMLYYKGYRAEDMDTGQAFEPFSGENGDVTVPLPAGYQGTLHVWYAGMWYWRAAEAVSLCMTVYMIYFAVCLRKNTAAL